MLESSYQIFRNSLGKVDAVNRRPDGATVPIWDETDDLTIELREWEATNGALDLSDWAVVPEVPEVPNGFPAAELFVVPSYLGFYVELMADSINLYLYVRYVSDIDLPVSNCYTDLMGAIQFGQLPGFQASISNLFAAMKAAGHEFSEAQTAQMRALLDAHGFTSIVFPLGGI